MVSFPILVLGIVRLLLRPEVLGVTALGMLTFRELYPRWRKGILRVLFDLVAFGLTMVVTIVVVVHLSQVPPHV